MTSLAEVNETDGPGPDEVGPVRQEDLGDGAVAARVAGTQERFDSVVDGGAEHQPEVVAVCRAAAASMPSQRRQTVVETVDERRRRRGDRVQHGQLGGGSRVESIVQHLDNRRRRRTTRQFAPVRVLRPDRHTEFHHISNRPASAS